MTIWEYFLFVIWKSSKFSWAHSFWWVALNLMYFIYLETSLKAKSFDLFIIIKTPWAGSLLTYSQLKRTAGLNNKRKNSLLKSVQRIDKSLRLWACITWLPQGKRWRNEFVDRLFHYKRNLSSSVNKCWYLPEISCSWILQG